MCERLNGPWASQFLASPSRTSIIARRRHRRCPGMEGAVRRNLGAQAINENGAVGHRSVEGPDTDNPVKSAPYYARNECRAGSTVPFPLAHQENLSDMLRVLGQIEKRGREISAGDVVRTMREILSTGLASDAACRRSIRKVRRTDDGPIERAGGDELFHPGKVGV